jgi:hypothetical protein
MHKASVPTVLNTQEKNSNKSCIGNQIKNIKTNIAYRWIFLSGVRLAGPAPLPPAGSERSEHCADIPDRTYARHTVDWGCGGRLKGFGYLRTARFNNFRGNPKIGSYCCFKEGKWQVDKGIYALDQEPELPVRALVPSKDKRGDESGLCHVNSLKSPPRT